MKNLNNEILREYVLKSIPKEIRKKYRIKIDTRKKYNKRNFDIVINKPMFTTLQVDDKFNIEVSKFGEDKNSFTVKIQNAKMMITLYGYKNDTPCIYVW